MGREWRGMVWNNMRMGVKVDVEKSGEKWSVDLKSSACPLQILPS